jgi:tetratricopeptide (TPR) repeat protein
MRGKTDPEPTYVAKDLNLQLDDRIANDIASNQWKLVRLQVKSYPGSRTFIQDGDLYLLRGNYKRAVKSYLQAIKFNNDISAYERIASAYITHKRFKEADEYLRKLLDLVDRRIDVLKKYIGFRLLFLGQLDIQETMNLINEILEKDPKDIEAYNYLGFISLAQNNLSQAQEYLEKCLEIQGDFVHALNNLGILFLIKNDFNNAEAYFKKAIKSQPIGFPFAYQNLASEKAMVEDYTSALAVLKEAKEMNISLENNWEHMMGWLMIKLGKFQDAKNWYADKLIQEPNNDLLYNNLGVCYRSLGDLKHAEENFLQAISIFRASPNRRDIRSLKAFYNLARVGVEKKEVVSVKKTAEDILRINPGDAYGLYFLGVSHVMRGQFKPAENFFERAYKIDPNIPELYPDYAFILESINKDSDKAIKLLNEGVQRGFQSPLLLNNLAYAHIMLGNLTKAEEIINSVLKDGNPIILATKGLLEMRKDNVQEGNKFYNSAIKRLDKNMKNLARQILAYENASYWIRKGSKGKARRFISQGLKYPETYFTHDIEELGQKLKKLS